MGRGSSSKMTRLNQLLGRLKSGDPMTAALLAEEFGVSARTLMRDLDALKDQGYPIETDQGRGGGVRLYARWGIGRLALNYQEVIDLLLALSVLEKMQSPLMLGNLKSVRNKLFASFPDAKRPSIRELRERILVGELASDSVQSNYQNHIKKEHTQILLEAFFDKRALEITYQRADGEQSNRNIEIHYLFLNWPVWYLIAWDYLREAPRTFRLDRISETNMRGERFCLKPLSEFSSELVQFSKPL